MELPDQFLDQADAYRHAQLNRHEAQAFEEAIAEGGRWRSEWQYYQKAREAVEASAEEVLKAKWKSTYQPETKTRQLPRWVWLAAAAGILLIIGFFFGQNVRNAEGADALYAQHTGVIQLSLGQRGIADADQQFAEANALLNKQKYAEAIPRLEALLSDSSFLRRDFALLHLGVCHLKTKQPEAALQTLNAISERSAFHYDALWYKALIAWSMGQLDKTSEYLQVLVKESKTYKTRASNFLEVLGERFKN